APRAAPAGAGRSARLAPGRCGSVRSARPAFSRGRRSYHHQVDEFIDRRLLQALLILAELEDRLLPLAREAAREIALELLDEVRDAFLAPALVADRIFHDHLGQGAAVVELHRQRIRDGALLRIEVILAELPVLDARHL